MTSENAGPGASHQRAINRYTNERAAAKYPAQYKQKTRDRREQKRILAGLEEARCGARLLDLPCGTGRLTRLLVERGFLVTGADSSPNMVEHAARNWNEAGTGAPITFEVRDVMDTGYEDDQFEAVMCNRLFHHLIEPESRRIALAELARICSGPIVVSFFNSFAFDALRRRFRHAVRGTKPIDRIPIPLKTFEADARHAGLEVVKRLPCRWGISPQWYLVLRKTR